MIHIAVFEDDSFYHLSAKRILSKVFEGKVLDIQIYKHWTDFEEQYQTEPIKHLDYVFLDDDLGRDAHGRFAHGEKVKKNLELLGFAPKFVGISRVDRDYVPFNIGKFPGSHDLDVFHLSEANIVDLRQKMAILA